MLTEDEDAAEKLIGEAHALYSTALEVQPGNQKLQMLVAMIEAGAECVLICSSPAASQTTPSACARTDAFAHALAHHLWVGVTRSAPTLARGGSITTCKCHELLCLVTDTTRTRTRTRMKMMKKMNKLHVVLQ